MRKMFGIGGVAVLLSCVPLAGGTATAQSSGEPGVELLEPGDGPREELRLSLSAGDTTTSVLTTEIEITQKLNGETQSQRVPPIAITMSTSVTEVATDGGATIEFSYDEAGVDDDGSLSESQLGDLQDNLDQIEGITGTLLMDTTGAAVDFQLDVPDGVDDSLRSLVEQLSDQADQLTVPYPHEAVGVGARWRVAQELEASGIDLTQTSTYELLERDGNQLTLGVRIKQRADRQTIDIPQGTAELIRSRANGKGTTASNLTEVFPESSSLQLTVKQRLKSGRDTLDQTVHTKVGFEAA